MIRDKINFCVGPVHENNIVKKIGVQDTPYFRTPEFSKIMLENEKLLLEFTNATTSSKAVFLTGSGTAAMEATIMNTLSSKDKALVVNGGSFGQRFCDMLKLHNIPFDEIKIPYGNTLTKEKLNQYSPKDYTCFLVNIHETSTGLKYDINLIHSFCQQNNLFLIVDAISSFLADEIDLSKNNIDVMIAGSQKAIACPPGISMLVLSSRAINRIKNAKSTCMYLDLKSALKNQERGQTPFTPAVSVLLQINARLIEIKQNGGVKFEIEKTKKLADYFRTKIINYPFVITSKSMSNAVTPLHPTRIDADKIVSILKDEYDIWVCPNGGDLSKKIFRVGHIGNLSTKHYDILFNAFDELSSKGIL